MEQGRPGNALVTGGGTGIGFACARALHAVGHTVTLMGRREAALQEAAARLDGDRVRCAAGDVTDEDAVERAVAAAAEGGALRVVVACAGTGWLQPIAQHDTTAFRHVVDTNLIGTFLTLKHAASRMTGTGGGAITAISSIAGAETHRYMSAYCASKAAVEMLVRTAADELGAVGIRVNAVSPGIVPTDLADVLVQNDEVREDYLRRMPVSRLGTVDDIADAVAFLSSDAAGWITGVVLPVDGGHHLRGGPVVGPLAGLP